MTLIRHARVKGAVGALSPITMSLSVQDFLANVRASRDQPTSHLGDVRARSTLTCAPAYNGWHLHEGDMYFCA